MKPQKPTNRLNYRGDLGPVIKRICDIYPVGSLRSFYFIDIGYEDCNVVVETSEGKFLAKMFSHKRSSKDIQRYTTIMNEVVKAGVNHPKLVPSKDGRILSKIQEISFVIMRYIDGKTFLELDRAPDVNERRAVIQQAVIVNHIDYHPPYLFDSWAIPNVKKMLDRVGKFILPEDKALVNQAIDIYELVPVSTLYHCFVHGDFTKANILKGQDGQIYILDFSVANWYPRIQELAVTAANLMSDRAPGHTLRHRCEIVASDYGALEPLTQVEVGSLYSFALVGVAMEFMGATQEKYINGNDTTETAYWLKLGRTSLKEALG